MKTFQKNPCEMSKSIIPVLTKVDPTNEDFDFDQVREVLQQIIDVNLSNFLIKLNNPGQDTEQLDITEDDIEKYEENSSLSDNELQKIIEMDKLKSIKEYSERK